MSAQGIKSCGRLLAVMLLLSSVALAQDPKPGKLKVKVLPKQAYTWVDGSAIGHGNRTIKLAVGSHHLIVTNYGYKEFEQDVSIDSDKTLPMDIKLEAAGGEVSGPRGRIQIEPGWHDHLVEAAVLLNGKKPGYFVGHVDEFNNNIIWKQELIVPPGTHQMTVTLNGKDVWSGSVTVAADQRVIIHIPKGNQTVKPWARGSVCQAPCDPSELTASLPRFRAGVASATVVVAPVSGSVSANPQKIDCNQNTQLAWVSNDTVDADMSGMSPVPTSGQKTISPRQTTTYQLTATGPGGVTTPSTTVDVNPVVQASLDASPAEVSYRRIGDKVIKQENTSLTWSSSNADTASLDPGGSVETSGTKSIAMIPARTSDGPVDEQVNYTFRATNVCGGSEVKTVAVHVNGSIEPIPGVPLQSVFFPSDYPDRDRPEAGLVRSQQEALTNLATGFKKYLEYDPDAKLSLSAYADERGSQNYNESLSQLRSQSVKDFLVSQGIAENKIDTEAFGSQKPLDKATVTDLQSRNPNQPPEARVRNFKATWLAYNRRVDIVLIPTKAQSEQFYPNQAPDSQILWQRAKPTVSQLDSNN
jgi:hypothetical protein